jgi:hypothetical protein
MIDFRLLGRAEILKFEAAANLQLHAWATHWFSDQTDIALSGLTSGPDPDFDSFRWYGCGEDMEMLCIGATPRDFAAFAKTLLGSNANSSDELEGGSDVEPLVASLVCAVAQDLFGRLLTTHASVEHPKSAAIEVDSLTTAHSGRLGLRISSFALTRGVHVFLTASATRRWLKGAGSRSSNRKPEALNPRIQAIGPAMIELHIELRDEVMSVGDVQNLKPGDIVQLTRSIRQPLSVATEAGIPIGSCHLGKIQAKRGIRLAKSAQPLKNSRTDG